MGLFDFFNIDDTSLGYGFSKSKKGYCNVVDHRNPGIRWLKSRLLYSSIGDSS